MTTALLASRRWRSPRVRALTTLRHGAGISLPPWDSFNLGERCGDDPAAVVANRRALAQVAQLPSRPRWLRQVHGTTVLQAHGGAQRTHDGAVGGEDDLSSPAAGSAVPEADAAVTASVGTVLAVLSADCLPVVLADGEGSEVAVAHAGWRGLAAGVLEATLAAMHTPAARVQAWLGPAAGPHGYEVGDEVRTAFVDAHAGAARAFAPTRPGHWHCDLYALARQRLAACGLTDVEGGTRCTISEPHAFFSHRRDGRTGRMATLAWLAATPG